MRGRAAGSPARVRRAAVLALYVAIALVLAPVATGDVADETALAERYAPVVKIVEQAEDCGHGEPFEPIDVALLLGEPTVALRGPWNAGDLIKIGPVAEDLADAFNNTHEGDWETIQLYALAMPLVALTTSCVYFDAKARETLAPEEEPDVLPAEIELRPV